MLNELFPRVVEPVFVEHPYNVEMSAELRNYELARNRAIEQIRSQYENHRFSSLKTAVMLWWLTPNLTKRNLENRLGKHMSDFIRTLDVSGLDSQR